VTRGHGISAVGTQRHSCPAANGASGNPRRIPV